MQASIRSIWSASVRLVSGPIYWAIYRLPLALRRRALFILSQERLPHFTNPITFNEKINWRILNDRRPLLEWTCDKMAMKERAARVPDLRVPETLWAGTDLRTLASAQLPEHWVLKPNHRSGLVYFGTGQPDIGELEARTAGWLRETQSRDLGEWAYSRARPLLLAEELIGTPGSPLTDYKFYVFDGSVEAILVNVDRHTSHKETMYLPDWSPLDVRFAGFPVAPAQPPPPRLDRMLEIASELGAEFDFIRVDLYNVSGSIFFGEFTPYVGSGFTRYIPADFDFDLGRKWRLPDLSATELREPTSAR